jgi:hypothetical protein
MMGKFIVGGAILVVIYIIFAYACGLTGENCRKGNHDG